MKHKKFALVGGIGIAILLYMLVKVLIETFDNNFFALLNIPLIVSLLLTDPFRLNFRSLPMQIVGELLFWIIYPAMWVAIVYFVVAYFKKRKSTHKS